MLASRIQFCFNAGAEKKRHDRKTDNHTQIKPPGRFAISSGQQTSRYRNLIARDIIQRDDNRAPVWYAPKNSLLLLISTDATYETIILK